MKKFFLILALLTLTECETTSDRLTKQATNDDIFCQNKLQLKPGSDGYANCRINMMQLRAQEYDRVQKESEFLINYGQYISRCGITGQYCR
jgi:hypothetical protein